MPVKVDGKGWYNDVHLDENQLKSVYGKNNLDTYIKNNSLEKIYQKERAVSKPEVQYLGFNATFSNSIPTNSEVVNKKRPKGLQGLQKDSAAEKHISAQLDIAYISN